MALSSDERGELIGQVLDGRYRIVRRIGLGGTGVVFEALVLADQGVVAIKTLRPCFVSHPDLGRRLQREGEIARRVRHPGIVPVLDEGTLRDGSPYLVMPLLTGESLSRLLLRLGTLDFGSVASIAGRVAAILHSAHCAGYVHRDVKPEHVLLERSPSGELLLYLLDFGVCSAREASADERGREKGKVFGTPSYVSPEQAAGECDVDGRADLFSLGVLMFEALAGRVPFAASSVSKLLLRIIQEDAPRVSHVVAEIEPAIDDIVARLMARDKEDRFPSARALSRALAVHVAARGHVEHTLASMVRVSHLVGDLAPAQRVA
ncbi:MAG TPA: serine/threonine-protein kinase [Polyangiales bacterium]|nr:serine/threonine-protein kinase [Polyangiales bacterium]